MQFDRRGPCGFKSLVDPTGLVIRDGPAGVVGPNGRGTSNLLEALRRVTGESRPTAPPSCAARGERTRSSPTPPAAPRASVAVPAADLTRATAKLRKGIGGLSRDGRARLLAAFEAVNASFGALSAHLFGRGKARLALDGSGAPLEAGLEIPPPGQDPVRPWGFCRGASGRGRRRR